MMPLPAPSRRPRAGLAVAAVLAVAVAVAAVVLLIRPAPGQAPGQPPPRSIDAGRVPARTPGSPPAGPAAVSTAGWYAVALDGTVVPASRQAGPGKGPWPLAAGFADSRAGAVLAAVNIAVRAGGQLGPDIFTATISRQVTGPGATALADAAWADYAAASDQHPPARPGGPAGTADATLRAFRLVSFSAAAAAVEVLAAADRTGGTQVVIRLQVRWLAGDWRLVAPAGGTFSAAAVPHALLSGFTSLPGR